jgi:hypothetical protein
VLPPIAAVAAEGLPGCSVRSRTLRSLPVDVSIVWAAVGALGAVAAAGVAAWAAYQSRSSAQQANAAAGTLAAIERARRHDELTPEFDITCTVQDTSGDSAVLHVTLKPGKLERLDGVTVTIQDETRSDHWTRGLPDGVSQEEAAAFVWGPFQFNTGASAQVVSNRTTRPRPYSLVTGKNWDVLGLTLTRPGRWMTATSQEDWRKQQAGKPVRLLLTCRLGEYEPWLIQCDVAVTEKPRTALRTI